jgi:hypothetical protein
VGDQTPKSFALAVVGALSSYRALRARKSTWATHPPSCAAARVPSVSSFFCTVSRGGLGGPRAVPSHARPRPSRRCGSRLPSTTGWRERHGAGAGAGAVAVSICAPTRWRERRQSRDRPSGVSGFYPRSHRVAGATTLANSHTAQESFYPRSHRVAGATTGTRSSRPTRRFYPRSHRVAGATRGCPRSHRPDAVSIRAPTGWRERRLHDHAIRLD